MACRIFDARFHKTVDTIPDNRFQLCCNRVFSALRLQGPVRLVCHIGELFIPCYSILVQFPGEQALVLQIKIRYKETVVDVWMFVCFQPGRFRPDYVSVEFKTISPLSYCQSHRYRSHSLLELRYIQKNHIQVIMFYISP